MTVRRLWLVVAAVFVFQVNTALSGAPDVCEEPCNEESGAAQLPVQAQAVESGPPEAVDAEVEPSELPGPAAMSGPDGVRLLPVHLGVPAPRGGIPVARGALGYRVPLVVPQRVPAQIRGGVYVPAHETYVILRPGHWELEGAAEDATPVAVVEPTGEPGAAKGCWLRRLFRKLGGCDGGS